MPTSSLRALDERLRAHYQRLAGMQPLVFAIDHGLDEGMRLQLEQELCLSAKEGDDISRLRGAAPHALIAWAAEVGLRYLGDFWPPFLAPFGDEPLSSRLDLTRLFEWFAGAYRGVTPPPGEWTEAFRHISWPLVNAVLPRSQQRYLLDELSSHWPVLARGVSLADRGGTPLADLLHKAAPTAPGVASQGYRALRDQRETLEIGLRCHLDLDVPARLGVSDELIQRLRDSLHDEEAAAHTEANDGGSALVRRREERAAVQKAALDSAAGVVALPRATHDHER